MPKTLNVVVTTPDSRIDFHIVSNSTGKQLFDQVAKTIGLREIWYFGLQFIDKHDQAQWIKMDRKLQDQPIKKEEPINFYFLVKYFPEDCSSELIQTNTQKLFYLQVKKAILKNDIYCSPETALLLASYQLCVRFGPYSPEICTPGFINVSNYLPERVLEQHELSNEAWEEKIVSMYKNQTDLTKEDAVLEYLKFAQDLEMYGVSYFSIKNKKKTDLWLGIDSMGLNIYPHEDKLTPTIGFPWSEVRNISYRDKKVMIKPSEKNSKDFSFTVDRATTSKTILALCVGNHDLYARRRKTDSVEVQQMKEQARQAREAREQEKSRLHDERLKREAAEAKLREMEIAMAQREEDHRRSEEEMQELQVRMQRMEDQLSEERAAREDLERSKEQLDSLNRQLAEESANTAEERDRLQAERETVLQEIERQRVDLSTKAAEIAAADERIVELQSIRQREAEQLQEATVKAMAAEALLTASSGVNGAVNGVDESGDHMFENMENADRREESRELYNSECFAKQLANLKHELNANRVPSKISKADVSHESNVKKGLDKFKTLKQIRQGNTKRRVDEFEAL